MVDRQRDYTVDERLSDADENVHSAWDNSLDPALTVEPGSVVRFECRDAVDRQIDVESTPEDVLDVSFDPVHPLTGPVAVEGAEPGDVLEVELLDLQHKGWGYNLFMPGEMGLGLLPEEFPDPGLYVWDLEGDVGHFVDGIEVPLDPFPGVAGVAPAADGEHDTLPPRSVGGNMDVKHLTAGSTLYLPVEVEGALFSTGDCHAAQGDGEVCVTGIEAPMFVTARFDVRSDMNVEQPQFETTGPFTPTGADEPMYGTTGIDPDLMEATKKAVSHMITHLHEERGLSRAHAYILSSAAVDLKVNEVVDAPNWTVSAYLPESVFPTSVGYQPE
ncbi:MAG: acetamidase/formamidase family protein [Haloarculaceae archaeon]